MKTTRAKFVCSSVTETQDAKEVKAFPVKTGSEENDQFFKSSPGGELKLYITNLPAAEIFKPGKSFYVDMTPCED
jgi:hypothetical protein